MTRRMIGMWSVGILLALPLITADLQDGKYRPSSLAGVEEAYLTPI